ncbi:MAG: DUF2961 domain-containing protein [Armatimonadota bacterium]|nr:DUF2961 domain-containing protein [Armatimonadota bacterium]
MFTNSLKLNLLTATLALGLVTAASASILTDLPGAKSYRSARISSYDKRGGNADGSQGNPLKPGQIRTMAEIKGPGQIAHIWITKGGVDIRDIIIRMYWDGENTPSVECPLGEFFGLGHGKYYTFESLPFAIGNDAGLNCFFPMPFKKSAKVTVQNVGSSNLDMFYYYIDYQVFDAPRNDLLYFHAQYRQEKPVLSSGNYVILDAAGRGHFVGCFLFCRQNEPGWFGEGDDMIYIDGAKQPTLNGTGTEDYFCHAWGFAKGASTARFGVWSEKPFEDMGDYSVYRFHLEDAIAFKKSIRVTIEHGHANNRSDDFSSIAYWYQTEPHSAFPKLAAPFDRRSSEERGKTLLKEKKFAEYREAQTQVARRTHSDYVRQTAEFNIADSRAAEVGGQAGVDALLDLLGPFPNPDIAKRVAERVKELGGDAAAIPQSGVYHILGVSDGEGGVVTMDGKRCVRTNTAKGSRYIYFDVDKSILSRGDKPIMLEIEYYDEGKAGDTFLVEYDSAFTNDDADKYRPTPAFIKPGKKGWNSAVLYLERARFGGRQNGGADFRVYSGGDTDEYVSSIKVISKQ